jgi:hypothetical protein
MSEMISEIAAHFISAGRTPQEKEARSSAACSAWNLACVSPDPGQAYKSKPAMKRLPW